MSYIEEILRAGIDKGASDIHLVKGLKPLGRINRELVPLGDFAELNDKNMIEFFGDFTKANEDLIQAFNKTKRTDINYAVDNVRFRVNISVSRGSYTYTARIIRNELPAFETLGLPDVVRQLALKPQGLILITGKSNSGKTTTLNALVNEINQVENKKILMLEDPIEYVHTPNKSLVVQKEVGRGRDCPDFGSGTINSLREDCDILIVGEVRDRETVDAMLELAEAGYLVIGTMHTRSCAETLDRIVNFFDVSDQKVIKYMLASVLKAVVSQRLLKGVNGKLEMCAEIMVVDEIIAGHITKDKLSKSEIEDAILTSQNKGSVSLVYALANLIVQNKIDMDVALHQLEGSTSGEHLKNTVFRMRQNNMRI